MNRYLIILIVLFIAFVLVTTYGIKKNIENTQKQIALNDSIVSINSQLEFANKRFTAKAKETDSLKNLLSSILVFNDSLNKILAQKGVKKGDTINIVELAQEKRQEVKNIVGIYSFKTSPEKIEQLEHYFNKNDYIIDSKWQLDQRERWLAYENTVFYYSKRSASFATKVASDLTDILKTKFVAKQGAGLGVIPGQEENTFFVGV